MNLKLGNYLSDNLWKKIADNVYDIISSEIKIIVLRNHSDNMWETLNENLYQKTNEEIRSKTQ